MPFSICHFQYAIFDMPFSICHFHYAIFNMPFSTCHFQYAIFNMLFSTFSLIYHTNLCFCCKNEYRPITKVNVQEMFLWSSISLFSCPKNVAHTHTPTHTLIYTYFITNRASQALTHTYSFLLRKKVITEIKQCIKKCCRDIWLVNY